MRCSLFSLRGNILKSPDRGRMHSPTQKSSERCCIRHSGNEEAKVQFAGAELNLVRYAERTGPKKGVTVDIWETLFYYLDNSASIFFFYELSSTMYYSVLSFFLFILLLR
nr:hypothetical protein LKY79_mgp136 [Beta macrocarpa]CBX24876.1 hypothetical protein [Beta macrocarpa]CBX33238.1 hypothetical protein [Beta vulgaris subsp. maritima]